MPVPCSGCQGMMSAVAVVCPHCGKRQSDRDPIAANAHKRATSRKDGVSVDPYRGEPTPEVEPKPKKKELHLSGEEARALLQVTGVAQGALEHVRPTGPMVLLLPRAEASGVTRTLEWTLTAAALPMILLGILPMFLRPRLWRLVADGTEWGLTIASAFFGGTVLFLLGDELLRLGAAGTWGMIAISGGALFGRAILRGMPARL